MNEHGFLNINEAKRIIEKWRDHYNAEKPYSSLGGLTPNERASQLEGKDPSIADEGMEIGTSKY